MANEVTSVAPLSLLAEYPVAGIQGGNLSGLTRCGGQWWTLSDRDDALLYQLEPGPDVWQAQPVPFKVSLPPPSDLPAPLLMKAQLAAPLRGGHLDFEGLGCDGLGQHYLISEATGALLQLDVQRQQGQWLKQATEVIHQGREHGLLQRFNALYEGLAVAPDGQQLWLAAERQERGLLRLVRQDNGQWRCPPSGCVLMFDEDLPPLTLAQWQRDFAGLSYFSGALFTLERSALRLCRRDPQSGAVHRCWSYAAVAREAKRVYPDQPFVAEALWIDDSGAWIGLDNNKRPRQDGEARPIIWHFAVPAAGWNE